MTKRLILPAANAALNILLGGFLSDATTVNGLENGTKYVAFALSEASNEFTPVSQYTNAQARLWASKLSTPLSNEVAKAYDQLFIDIGDLITAKADSFGICATETQEAAIKNLVQNAPDLSLINTEVLSWQQFHGFAQLDFGATTYIDRLLIEDGGTGYTNATFTIGAPGGSGPVQAVFTAVIEGGKIVGATPVNKGAGYAYTAGAAVPAVSVVGDGTGAKVYADLYMGRVSTNIKPAGPGMKAGQQDISIGIGSTQYNGARGAGIGGGSLAGIGTSSRVSIGSTIANWMGVKIGGGADLGVYTPSNVGHYVVQRKNASNLERYFNGGKISNANLAVTTNMADEPLYLMGRFKNDSYKNTSRHSWFWVGKALSDDEAMRLYYAINRFLVAMGVEVAATRTVQGSVTSSNTLSSGATITYSIDPSPTPSEAHFDVEQIGSLTDASFANSFVASVTAACTASGGKYTFDGAKTITIVAGTTTPLTWTRTLSANAATGATHGFKVSNGTGILFNQSSQVLMQGAPALSVIPKLKGVNLSGMEFSTGTTTAAAFFPSQANVDIYASRGFNVLRLPMKWARLQHTLNGPLDIVGDGTGDAEKYKAIVDYITNTKGMYCIIEAHDYGGRGGVTGKVGSENLTVAAYEDFWIKLINYLGINNQKIIINLANEPLIATANGWMKSCNSLTAAIRTTGSLQHIQVPGIAYTGAHSWVSSGNAAAMLNYVDPANNYSFEVHQYLDSDSSGTNNTCTVNSGSTRMAAFLDWCTTNNKKGFLGEVAGAIPTDAQCSTELSAILNVVNASAQMTGWAAWGGGANWSTDYFFRIENPTVGGADTAIMNMLKSKI